MIKRSIFFIFFFLFFSVTAFAENSFEFDLPEGYILGDIEEEGIEEEDVPNTLDHSGFAIPSLFKIPTLLKIKLSSF